MDQGIYWFPIGDFHLPYMREIYDITEDTIVYMGFFYVEPETLPIEALLYKNNICYKCIITHKDFINYEGDEDRDFSAFPRHYLQSETITLKYKNLGRLGKTPDDDAFFKKATDKRAVIERNNEFIYARQEREHSERRVNLWKREHPELFAIFTAPTTALFEEQSSIVQSDKLTTLL